MNTFPKAKRQLEYVAFFDFELPTKEGPAHVFIAVDAYSEFAFMLGVEPEKNSKTVLKNIYFLMENEDFAKYLNKGWDFTLVLNQYEELSEEIENILRPVNGKLLFSKSFNNYLSNPVLKSFVNSLPR